MRSNLVTCIFVSVLLEPEVAYVNVVPLKCSGRPLSKIRNLESGSGL
jgi:hypothetical protein